MTSAKITSKGQISLPKDVRSALGLEPGDRVTFTVQDGTAILRPVRVRTPAELRGSLATDRNYDLSEMRTIRAHELADKVDKDG